MKIVIYKSDRNVPFKAEYDQLGSTDKIIFYNRAEQIINFNEKDVEYLVRPWLPKRSIMGSDKEDTIFYVPFAIKEKFMDILEKLIEGFKKMMGRGERDSIPTSDQLGLGKESSLASFYNEMEIQEVIMTKPEARKKVEALFNSISEDDNEIDAVLVCTYDGKISTQCSSTSKENRKVDTGSYAVQLKDLVSLLTHTKKVNPKIGELEHVEFQYSGGIIHITHLPKYGDYTFLIFVSATKEGVEMLEFFRNKHLEEIQGLLDDFFA